MVRLLTLLFLISPMVSLGSDFYDQQTQGWYWYDEAIQSRNNEVEQGTQMSIETAKAEIENLKKELEDKKALALSQPTEKNLKDYITVQNEVNKKAELFAMTWQKVIIKNPELDHTVTNPTNSLARRVHLDEKAQGKKQSVQTFTSKYGMFFFFRSNCQYCHKFAPILKMFEEEYGVTVIPVSLDGQGLPEYPNPKPDNGIAKKLNIDIVPALIAVAPKSGEIIPVSYGLVSVEELTYRINLLAQDVKGARK